LHKKVKFSGKVFLVLCIFSRKFEQNKNKRVQQNKKLDAFLPKLFEKIEELGDVRENGNK
jgi:hypothetical protein